MTNYTADEDDEENYSECEEYDGHENFGERNVDKSELECYREDLQRLREQILKEAEALLSKALGEGKSELGASSVVIREGEKFEGSIEKHMEKDEKSAFGWLLDWLIHLQFIQCIDNKMHSYFLSLCLLSDWGRIKWCLFHEYPVLDRPMRGKEFTSSNFLGPE